MSRTLSWNEIKKEKRNPGDTDVTEDDAEESVDDVGAVDVAVNDMEDNERNLEAHQIRSRQNISEKLELKVGLP